MTIRYPAGMVLVAPNKVQDPLTESFISVETQQCAQLPQSLNNATPRIMRKVTAVSQIQACGNDGNKYQLGRFVVKFEVLTGVLPTGGVILTPSFSAFTPADVDDTLESMIGCILNRGPVTSPNPAKMTSLNLISVCPD